MKKKSLRAKNTKKALEKKVTLANKSKALSEKTQHKAKKTVRKEPKTALKRLGKGLKDISHLFLSGAEKSSAKSSIKTKKTAVLKIKKAATEQSKKDSVSKAKQALTSASKKALASKAKGRSSAAGKKTSASKTRQALTSASKKALASKAKETSFAAGKKTSASKAKQALTSASKKALASKAKETSSAAGKKAEVAKTKETAFAVMGKKAKPVAITSKKKTSAKEKNDSAKTKKIIEKTSKKKIEVIRMPIAKKSGGKAESISKRSKKVVGSKASKKTKSAVKRKSQLKPISELSALFKKNKKKAVAFSGVSAQPEQRIEESKFFTGPAPVAADVKNRRLYELPAGYGDTRIVIQVRDPYWMHAYWEISEDRMNALRRDLGHYIHNARRILRVYDVTNLFFDGSNANKYFDIDINDHANSWYINGQEAGRSFCVDIGYLLDDERFIMIARSNCLKMPIDGPSAITDEEWMIVEDDFNRLYGMSVGLGVGLSSMEMRKQISQRLMNVSSGALFSPGVQIKPQARKFWLKVQTELIVYGATVPGAKVSIQGKPITLNKDGTFSLRFALPEGQQVIPVKGVSEDGLEERQITSVVTKKIE